MNEAINNLTTAAESSPYPITFTLHEKIRDRFPDTTFHTAYRLYLNTFNQVKDWEKTLVEIIIRKFEYDLENRKLVSE